MTDELAARRKAQRDEILESARSLLNERASELRGNGKAIVELLDAVAIYAERLHASDRQQPAMSIAKYVWIVAGVLRVSDASCAAILDSIYQQEAVDG